jgi:hypothetical protein
MAFTQSTILCAHFYFKLISSHLIGLKPFTLSLTCSSDILVALCISLHRMKLYFSSVLIIPICIFLITCVFQTLSLLNKLSPRSTACIFIGDPHEHKGYHYLELSSNKVIISHVIFDELTFQLAIQNPASHRFRDPPCTQNPGTLSWDLIPVRSASIAMNRPRVPAPTTTNMCPTTRRTPCGP